MEKKRILRENKLIENIINEELGINNDVKVLSFNLANEVIENYDGSGKHITCFTDSVGKNMQSNLFSRIIKNFHYPRVLTMNHIKE